MNLVRRLRGQRGGAEVGLVAIVGMLAAGAVFGSGLAQTVLTTPDPLTWLSDRNGRVTRVNPVTGRAVDRLRLGGPGDELRVTQGDDGVLVVTNTRTGAVTLVDLSVLSVSGTRTGNAGSVKVLLSEGQIYLADLAAGLVERIDATTAATVGKPWRSDVRLADAVVDAARMVWVIDHSGRLVALESTGGELVERQRRAVDGAGAQAVLVGHRRGVTVLDPRTGAVAQVGTEQEYATTAKAVTGPLDAAESSPDVLVPAAAPQAGTVVLARPDRVVQVSTAELGCREPRRPAVYRGVVYTPCPGDRKVIVLDQDGRRVQPDIPTPGDPVLVANAGLLIINVPGAATALVVQPDGSTKPIRIDDPAVPVRDPQARPTALPPGPGTRATQGNPPGRVPTQGPGPRPTGTGPGGGPGGPPPTRPVGRTPPPTTPAARPADFTPTAVAAQARADSTIQVSWTPAPRVPASHRILRADTGDPVTTAPGGAAFAIITGFPLGQEMAFVVEAVTPSGSYRSAPSNAVAAFGRPGGPTVSVELVARGPARLSLRVAVGVVSDRGSTVTGYDLTVVAGGTGRTLARAMSVPIGQSPYQVDVTCVDMEDLCLSGGSVDATAVLYNGAGGGPAATVGTAIAPPPPWQYNGSTIIVTAGNKCLDSNLGIQTCNGSFGQFWSIRDTGEIRNPANGNQCLDGNNGLHFVSSGCRDRPRRWDLLGTGNTRRVIRNQETDRCIYVNGDVAGEGVQFRDRNCLFNAQESFAFFTPTLPLTASSTEPAAARDSAIGVPVTTLLLAPVAVGLIRRRRR